jgi:hypothetical protein
MDVLQNEKCSQLECSMSWAATIDRYRNRSFREWLLLAEAGLMLVIARGALRLLPTMRIVNWVRRPIPNEIVSLPSQEIKPLCWAVAAFSQNAPIRLVCFPQAIALHAMLRRRHAASEILYGVARTQEGKLLAHAWLRCADRIWLGGEVSSEFTVLDTWKPTDPSDAQAMRRPTV